MGSFSSYRLSAKFSSNNAANKKSEGKQHLGFFVDKRWGNLSTTCFTLRPTSDLSRAHSRVRVPSPQACSDHLVGKRARKMTTCRRRVGMSPQRTCPSGAGRVETPAHRNMAQENPRCTGHLGFSNDQNVDKRWGNLSTKHVKGLWQFHRQHARLQCLLCNRPE